MERLQLQFEGGCFGGHINIILVVLYTHFDFRLGEKRVSIKKFVRLNFFVELKRIQSNEFFNRHPFFPHPKIKVGIQNY